MRDDVVYCREGMAVGVQMATVVTLTTVSVWMMMSVLPPPYVGLLTARTPLDHTSASAPMDTPSISTSLFASRLVLQYSWQACCQIRMLYSQGI